MFRPFFVASLVLLGCLVAVFEALGLGFIQPIFDVATSGELKSGRITGFFASVYKMFGIPFNLESLILGVSAVMVIRYSITFLLRWYKTVLSKKYEAHLKKKGFSLALNGKIRYLEHKGSDDIVNHVNGETSYAGKLISTSTGVMKQILLVMIYVGVMAFISPVLALLTIGVLGGVAFLLRFVLTPAIQVGSNVAEANEKVQQTVQSGVQGVKEVKLFGMIDRFDSRLDRIVDSYIRNRVKISRNENASKSFYKMTAALTVFLLIYVGIEHTNLNFGNLGIFLLALYRFSGTLSSLNSRIYRIEGYLAHYMRAKDFMENLSGQQEERNAGQEIQNVDEIVFENVSFSYGDEDALQEVSFGMEKCEFIGLAGKSGAGKSTIVSLIAQMYEPDSGEITCNRIDIEEYSLESWRERVAVVQQQSFVFNATLEKNIRIGKREACRDEIKRICQTAEIDEFLEDLPDGLDTEIGDNGVRLSGGQRQRVTIARALLKNPDILILDEATSELDLGLEKKIYENIEETDRDYGIVAVAHRLSTLKNSDRIYTVEDGRIKEEGSHQELLDAEGIYSQLYKIQKNQ
jgi:subfamily B ATP-binding cassette protein MsbA